MPSSNFSIFVKISSLLVDFAAADGVDDDFDGGTDTVGDDDKAVADNCEGVVVGAVAEGGGGLGMSNKARTASCFSTNVCTMEKVLLVVQYTKTACGMVIVNGIMAKARPRMTHLNVSCWAVCIPSAPISTMNRKDNPLATGNIMYGSAADRSTNQYAPPVVMAGKYMCMSFNAKKKDRKMGI